MHEPSRNWDSLVYAFARPSTPTTWEQRAVRNDFRASDEFGRARRVLVLRDGRIPCLQPYATNEVYADGYVFVGADDAILPGSPPHTAATVTARGDITVILGPGCPRTVNVTGSGLLGTQPLPPVHATPDASGLLIVPARGLPAGAYFVTVDAPGLTMRVKTVVVD